MVTDMLTRIEKYIVNLADITHIEIEENPANLEHIKVDILYKCGETKTITVKKISYQNFMSYFNALCPDLNDDYTRNGMVQAIMHQRQQFFQKLMSEGKLPKTDFPEKMQPGVR